MSSRPKSASRSPPHPERQGFRQSCNCGRRDFQFGPLPRRLDQRSKALENAGAEIFVGNQYSLTDMRAAMNGVKRAYQCAPGAPNALHFNAIHCGGLRSRGSNTSSRSEWLASADHPHSSHARSISVISIAMRPEMTVTTINVGWFADNYLGVGIGTSSRHVHDAARR